MDNGTLQILQTVTEQNQLQFDHLYYKQTDGLAMGTPISAVLTKTYLEHMEHNQIYPVLIKCQIIGCFQYVDDVLTICDQSNANVEKTLNKFNELQPSIKFPMEKEPHNSIHFLDLAIHRKDKIKFCNI
jgi:hypothetical protein